MLEKNIKNIEVEELPIINTDGNNFIIKQSNPNKYTHSFFKYPCKFIPEIPRWGIKKYMPKDGNIVFDPFAGSGTTLLESKIQGFDSCGTEIDPIAKMIILVKTQTYTLDDLLAIDRDFESIIIRLKTKNDDIPAFRPEINNLTHWFTNENLDILGKLKYLISQLSNKKSKTFLELVFISIVKAVSQADDSSPKPYVSRKVIKIAPNALEKYIMVYKKYRKDLDEYAKLHLKNTVRIVEGDALFTKEEFIADLAITSPPYINAFDYPRTMRLENLWMETHTEKSILHSKSKYVGTESFSIVKEKEKALDILGESELLKDKFTKIEEIDLKRALVLKRFFEDMKLNLINVRNHLKNNSKYIIVIGNSVIRKELIESWKILRDIAENNGYKFVEHFTYKIQNPYIRIPRGGKGGHISHDHILVLEKV